MELSVGQYFEKYTSVHKSTSLDLRVGNSGADVELRGQREAF